MWQHPAIQSHTQGNVEMRILETQFNYTDIPIPKSTLINIGLINETNVNFLSEASKNEDGFNPIDIKLSETGAYVIELKDNNLEIKDDTLEIKDDKLKNNTLESKLIGEIIAIPCNIYLKKIGEQNSVLSTHLIIDPEYRKKRCAETLGLSVIKEASSRNIKIGYHWISQKRTDFGIESFNWFRPLSLSKIIGKGYQVHKGVSYQAPPINKDVTHSNSIANDFKVLKSAPIIKLIPTQEQLNLLTKCITFLTFKMNNTVIGIVGFRKFDIIKPKNNILIDAVQICYFDTSKDMEDKVFVNLLHILKEFNYAAVHGVLMSNFFNLVEKHYIRLSSPVFLDFFNITHPNLKNTDVSLLYI